MKVLIVHPQMALYAGAEIVVVKLAHYLQEYGHKVSILTLSTANRPEYEGLNFILPEREEERIQYRLRGGLNSLKDIFQMYKALRRLCTIHIDSFDSINPHNFPAVWAIPHHEHIVWMCNEIPDLWHGSGTNGLVNQLFNAGRLVDRLIARSKSPVAVVADKQCAQRFHHRYGLDSVIIPYGIEGDFLAQQTDTTEVCQYYEFDEKDFRVMHSAMISPSKNQMEVIEAIELLKLRIPNIKVVFSGYREPLHPYTLRLNSYIVSNHLSQRVVFADMMSRERLRALYHTSHVAVFAGKGQGSWLGPFEQLSAGIPVIVSPNLSCSAIIAENNLGTVTNDLVPAIKEIYDNYSKYREQALRGREFVLDNLTWDKFGERMLELMEK